MFSAALFVVCILGFIKGAAYIQDPGQPFTSSLPWWYLLGSVLFLLNGYLSHKSTVRAYEATMMEEPNAEVLPDGPRD
jgi:hypothetical protein